MEYDKAIAVLKTIAERYPLSAEEKEAVLTAMGVLSWGVLAKSKLKTHKARRDNSTKW